MTARRIALSLLLLAGIAALIYTLYLQTLVTVVKGVSSQPPHYTLDDVDWVRYDDAGNPSLRGHAAQVDYYNDQHATGTNLHVTVLRKDAAAWIATAPSGVLQAGDKRMRLDGKVQIRGHWPDNGQPLQVDTTRLWIDPHAHELSTGANVTLSSAHRNGSATGLRANWMTHTLKLLADVKMTYDQSTH